MWQRGYIPDPAGKSRPAQTGTQPRQGIDSGVSQEKEISGDGTHRR